MQIKGKEFEINITSWALFWIFMIFYFAVDTLLFLKGYNTLFWHYKTDAELEIQKLIINGMSDK